VLKNALTKRALYMGRDSNPHFLGKRQPVMRVGVIHATRIVDPPLLRQGELDNNIAKSRNSHHIQQTLADVGYVIENGYSESNIHVIVRQLSQRPVVAQPESLAKFEPTSSFGVMIRVDLNSFDAHPWKRSFNPMDASADIRAELENALRSEMRKCG
jgi:hypothetical protein